jgi:putative DNA primase/helicase
MTVEIISQFIDAMRSSGCSPANDSEILPTGEDEYFRIEGDRKDKRGGYYLTILPDGFAYGNFVNFKTGDKGSWHSKKSVKGLSAEEKAANNARVKQLEAERKAITDARHKAAAEDAAMLWEISGEATDHPYLAKKGIRAHGARLDGKDLIIRGVIDGETVTYQRISPDGTKLFLAGAKKQGSYYPIGDVTDHILICEGFATGASLHEATGHHVRVAFDAGNLQPVSLATRKAFPNAQIIICADNDKWGQKNTGVIAAEQAAYKINGIVAEPEHDDGVSTDWNDSHLTHGSGYIKDKISSVIAASGRGREVEIETLNVQLSPPESLPLSVYDDRDMEEAAANMAPQFDDNKLRNRLLWKKWPTNNDAGKMEPNSLHNIIVYLRHHPKYAGLFRYDKFGGKIIVARKPFWAKDDKFKPVEINDNDVSYITASMECDLLSPTSANVLKGILLVAHENWINPPLTYFESIKWDGVARVGTWMKTYLGAVGDDEYLSTVGACMLISIIARTYVPGCKSENMTVLEGIQGLMKSTALKILSTIGSGENEESYFCDTLSFDQISEKDAVLKLRGKIIIEFPDMAGMNTREVESIKAWISIQDDEIREPYGRSMVKFPRRFTLVGSTNESHWLKDQTGNRRFWPVKCGSIDIEALKRDREQLQAEAVEMYKAGVPWWVGRNSPVWEKVENEQKFRLMDDIWHEPIERFVENMNFVTVREVLSHLRIEVKDQTAKHQVQVTKILKQLGYESKQHRVHGGKPVSGWMRKKIILDAEFEEVKF